jgi:transcriptional regulator with XRE-family HTH domain
MQELRQAWGAAVRKRREALSLRQTELAERAGIRQSTLSDLETGRHTPSDTVRMALARELRMPVGELFVYADAPAPDTDTGGQA